MTSPLNILFIEDSPADVRLELRELERAGHVVNWHRVETAADLRAALARQAWDVILSDYHMPGFTGAEALAIVRERDRDQPFIFISGTLGEEAAVAAMKAGAQDYVMKDNLQRFAHAVERELREAQERRARQRVDAALREREQQMRIAQEGAHFGTFTWNIAGNSAVWSPELEALHGLPPGGFDGTFEAWNRLIHPEDRLAVAVRGEKAIATCEPMEGEWRVVWPDGSVHWIFGRFRVFRDERGQSQYMTGVNIDISEKKKLEEQFLRTQRLESIGMLAAGIAHDLNNVLAPILLVAPLLRETAGASDASLLDTLEACAERGAGLVRQILGFAHGIGGEPRLVQVKHVLRDIVQIITETFPKSINLAHTVPSDLWPVLANPTQIHQVLLNLCVNARDAMPDGGTLRVGAVNCRLDADMARGIVPACPGIGACAGAWLVLEVEDTGTGIPPEVLARIWEPFFTTKSADKGTGLGLPSVRGIVESHRGFITVRSAPGAGTAFRVYLPAAEADTPAGSPRNAGLATPATGHGELILLADDEEPIRKMAATILRAAGYQTAVACDGAEAAALFRERAGEIALCITDCDMPKLGGAALARLVRTSRPAVPILAMSGLTSRHTPHRPAEFADAFLPKPFEMSSLLQTVDHLLHRASTTGRAAGVPASPQVQPQTG